MIQALSRAANILRIVAGSENGLPLCELARACDMNRHTVYNLAETLVKERLLLKSGDKAYMIGDGILELADRVGQTAGRNRIRTRLTGLHLKYPDSTIYYSELSGVNIMARIHFSTSRPGEAASPENITLNPYLTVAGLIFFAFADEAAMHGVELNSPFDYSGLQAWGGMKLFMRHVASVKKKGYAETPHLVPDTELKIGIPVWKKAGGIAGAVTFHLKSFNTSDRQRILDDVLQVTSVSE